MERVYIYLIDAEVTGSFQKVINDVSNIAWLQRMSWAVGGTDAQIIKKGGAHYTWIDQLDPHAGGSELFTESLGKAAQGKLAGTVNTSLAPSLQGGL
jgi:hypothetical protein